MYAHLGGLPVVRSIILVAALLVGLLYSSVFLMWNAETRANVILLNVGGSPYWVGGVPVGFLPILGAIVGAAVMAIFAWVPWASQRAATRAAEAKLQKAMERLGSQKAALAKRDEDIADLQSQLSQAQAAANGADGVAPVDISGEGAQVPEPPAK